VKKFQKSLTCLRPWTYIFSNKQKQVNWIRCSNIWPTN